MAQRLPQHVLDEDAWILKRAGYSINDLAVRFRVNAAEAKAMAERGGQIVAERSKAEWEAMLAAEAAAKADFEVRRAAFLTARGASGLRFSASGVPLIKLPEAA